MEVDVVVVGDGATGPGVAWDLTLRGLLVEMGDVATGTSGRYHGALHTGTRYAASDLEIAKECCQKHEIVRRVAPETLDDTDGLFVLSPKDDEPFIGTWLEGCRGAGIPVEEIPVEEIPVKEALEREPLVHKGIRHAYDVPDASCDSFALCGGLRKSAESEGARFLTYHRVEEVYHDGDRVTGVWAVDQRTGEGTGISRSAIVNAAGPWVSEAGKLAGAEFGMVLSRGAVISFNGRWTHAVVSRLRLRKRNPRGQPESNPHLRCSGARRARRRTRPYEHCRRQAHHLPAYGREDKRRCPQAPEGEREVQNHRDRTALAEVEV